MITKEIYQIDGGFGYRIKRGDAILMDQPHAPVIGGYMDSTQAQQIADLFIALIDAGRFPVSVQELSDLETKIIDIKGCTP